MTQSRRLPEGGFIDRDTTLRFSFNGRPLEGYAGDSLASALLANGISLVARSFKYHRLRGILSAGLEEPTALVSCRRRGEIFIPNLKATEVRLENGMEARSQNCWPTLEFDLGALLQPVSALLAAGFYYKTFMWPGNAWMFYERFIRAAAGMRVAPAAVAAATAWKPGLRSAGCRLGSRGPRGGPNRRRFQPVGNTARTGCAARRVDAVGTGRYRRPARCALA